MYRSLVVLSFLVSLAGCNQSLDKSELLGTWVSDKEMTLDGIKFESTEADNRRYAALENMLGEMAYVFRENETTFTPFDSIDEQATWFSWELVESTERMYKLEVKVNGVNKKLEFLKKNGCIGLQVEVADFIEYFCKKS